MVEIFNALAALFSLVGVGAPQNFVFEDSLKIDAIVEVAGTAYLEYNFPSSVARINVDLSYWSSQELVESPNFTCCFEYFDRTSAINPVKLIDLVNDVELSTDRYNQDNFAFHFSKNNLTKFRFYSTSDALGDRNKGRLSIGDMVIFYET